jgi:transposase InsO family protein
MDFAEPPLAVDGIFPRILLVRDLSSGEVLAARATMGESSSEVVPILEELFKSLGAPLVVKSDNGSGLVDGDVPELRERYGVIALRSPPYTPSYNGACEAGVGSIKVRTARPAAQARRPGEWTTDDLEGRGSPRTCSVAPGSPTAGARTRSGRTDPRRPPSNGRSCAGTATWPSSGSWRRSTQRMIPRTPPCVLDSTAQP